MTANDDFFRDKRAAAVLKHGILKRYLAAFAGAVGSNSPGHKVGYLDGYAGEGEYVNPVTGVTSEGSPRIALTIAHDLKGRSRDLRCVFVEKEAEAFTTLQSIVASSPVDALALEGDVRAHLATALSEFANMPALVFLDPFGTALEHELAVGQILKRAGDHPTELLLNFSVQTLRRTGARIYEAEGAVGREATLKTIDEWLGGSWWRDVFLDPAVVALPKNERADTAAMRVAEDYRRQITKATKCGSFAVPIRRKPSDKPIFILTLFYPRRVAVFKYNDAVSLALRDWRKFLYEVDLAEAEEEDAKQPVMFGPSRVEQLKAIFDMAEVELKEEAILAIKESITTNLVARQSLSVLNDFGEVMGSGLGIGRETHLRAAWKQLAKEGLVHEPPTGDLDRAVIHKVAVPTFESF